MYSFWWDLTNDWGFDLLQFTPRLKYPSRSSLPRPLVLPAMHESEEPDTSPRSSMTLSALSLPRTSFYRPSANSPPYPYGLRPRLLYPLPVYPLALFINLILRLTWSVKLSSHLHSRAQGEGSLLIFWLEVAELVRRWVWVFIRVEWEIVRRAQDAAKHTEMSDESRVNSDAESFELVGDTVDEPLLKDQNS
jgi:EXS family